MKGTKLFSGFIALLLTIALVSGCKKNETLEPGTNNPNPSNNYNPPAVTFSATVQGFVVDDAGNAVSGADVKTGGKSIKTDINGYYRIENAPFTGDFCYIKAVKKGFFTGSTTVHGKAGSEYVAEMVLVTQNNIVSFPAAQGKTIALQSGAEVQLPANGYVTFTGSTYNGNVNVAVKHIDPTAKNFSSLIPGGDLRAFDANNKNVILYSYGMLNVEMRDDAGNLLQLAKDNKATLTIPVPQTMMATAPITIPLWYFDDNKGVWIEDGSATMQGNSYVGTVSHFTEWNVDVPYQPSIVKGKVVDAKSKPVPFAKLKLNAITVTTNSKGEFTADAYPSTDILLDYLDEFNEEFLSLNIKTKALGANEVLDLGNITLNSASQVIANAINCDGLGFSGYGQVMYGPRMKRVIVKDGNCSFYMPSTGDFASLILNSENLLYKKVVNFSVPSITSKVNLGNVFVCEGTVIVESFSFTFQKSGFAPVDISYTRPYRSYCFYVADSNESLIELTSSDDPFGDYLFRLRINIHGNKPGKYVLGSSPSSNFLYEERDQNSEIIYLTSKSMELEITKYGEMGDWVTGTFSGTAKDGDDDVTITNGFFVTRHK